MNKNNNKKTSSNCKKRELFQNSKYWYIGIGIIKLSRIKIKVDKNKNQLKVK